MINRYRMYWQGKSLRVRKATETFLYRNPFYWKSVVNKDWTPEDHDGLPWGNTVKVVAAEFGVSFVSIINNAKMLRYMNRQGVIDLENEIAQLNVKEAIKNE